MDVRTRSTRVFALCAMLALGISASLLASAQMADLARLTQISSRIEDTASVVAIEASDPVPYVASQPEPNTFVVELRDVQTSGIVDRFARDPRSPFASVRVETGRAADGANVARVRFTLTESSRPRVRSARNVIFVETDRLDRKADATDPIAALLTASANQPAAQAAPALQTVQTSASVSGVPAPADVEIGRAHV